MSFLHTVCPYFVSFFVNSTLKNANCLVFSSSSIVNWIFSFLLLIWLTNFWSFFRPSRRPILWTYPQRNEIKFWFAWRTAQRLLLFLDLHEEICYGWSEWTSHCYYFRLFINFISHVKYVVLKQHWNKLKMSVGIFGYVVLHPCSATFVKSDTTSKLSSISFWSWAKSLMLDMKWVEFRFLLYVNKIFTSNI